MRGHEQIARDRRRGYVPGLIFVECDGYNDGYARLAALGCRPLDHIEIRPTENPLRLDLRCVIGVPVEVSGNDETCVAAVARACVAHGASQVVAIHSTATRRGDDYDVQIHRITFTNGALEQWP